MARALSVELILSYAIDHPRVSRTLRLSADRSVTVIRVQGPDDVDDELRGWLTRAYDEAADA
jgi:hypothetical protein